jgi:hypothetical protein
MNYIIHVNQHVIRFNSKYKTDLPAFRIQHGRSDEKPRYAKRVIWQGPSETVYSEDNPLRCGAKIWIETAEEPTLIDECYYSDIRVAMEDIKLNDSN